MSDLLERSVTFQMSLVDYVRIRKAANKACKEAGIPFNLAWYIRRVLEKEVGK